MFLDENNKKIIPSSSELNSEFTHRSLAYWIMDDGQKVKRGGVTLCTDSFQLDEVESLRSLLAQNFDMVTTIHKKKNKVGEIYNRIYINKESLDKNKEYLLPHLHESMLYKIHAENLNSTTLVDQDQVQPTSFKQNTKDFFCEDGDNLLGNIFEEN